MPGSLPPSYTKRLPNSSGECWYVECGSRLLRFVIMQTLYAPVRNRRKASFERRVLDDIDHQLDDMRQELEQYVK